VSDSTYILVLADTHVATLEQLPERLLQLVKETDYVVHCGDFTEIKVVKELRSLAKRFIGVYGNTDSPEVKELLPTEAFLEIHGKKIAITHPYFGGPPWGLEEELVERYPNADVILFGHTHDACSIRKNGTLLFNPGQGYPMFIQQASVGILKVTAEGVEGRISSVDGAFLF
jgi:putative phosphoesterase